MTIILSLRFFFPEITKGSIGRRLGIDTTIYRAFTDLDNSDWISTMYSLFDTAAYDGCQLLWPHEHSAPAGSKTLRERARREEPIRPNIIQNWFLGNDPESVVSNRSLPLRWKEKLKVLKDKFGGSLVDRLSKDGVSVPYVFPLPVELMIKILSYLRGSDILAFAAIDCADSPRLQVPEFLWEAQFGLRGEAGHASRDSLYPGMESSSALARFLTARGDFGYPVMGTLRRLWNNSLMMLDVISDVRKSETCNVAEVGETDESGSDIQGEQGLRIEIEGQKIADMTELSRCGGIRTIAAGRIGPFEATGVFVSYTGSDAMRFVSGLRFLPGGEKIGLVNPEDQVYLPLCAMGAKETENLELWAAIGPYGIRSMTVTKADETPCWRSDPQMTLLEGRGFKASKVGIEVTQVSIAIDASKATKLGMQSPNFTGVKSSVVGTIPYPMSRTFLREE
ncbi:hypothetical protein Dda_0689 [Drechslerella dactyloides]|uniref:F-box domain-containing protein n=1 Tax=Drechslerella dactyloides TaxID=74499 RepID=A0AAD6J657_DREDA|nr:hypothetical protein Dda_0689 [Drechslerella dactyloides]